MISTSYESYKNLSRTPINYNKKKIKKQKKGLCAHDEGIIRYKAKKVIWEESNKAYIMNLQAVRTTSGRSQNELRPMK